jgi:hypothetical protein
MLSLTPLSTADHSERTSSPAGHVYTGSRSVHTVYLGGNIYRTDWRHALVSGLGPAGVVPVSPYPSLWPVLPAAVAGRFDYVGPYSLSGDPTDDAEWNSDHDDDGSEWIVSGPLSPLQRGSHITYDARRDRGQTQPCLTLPTSSQEVWWPLVRSARQVNRLVLEALRRTDLYFAWLDTPLCASTLTEIGWAAGRGKVIWVAGPASFDELWLSYTLADQYSFDYTSPAAAFQTMLQRALRAS